MTASGSNSPSKTPPWQLWGIRLVAFVSALGLAGACWLAITVGDEPLSLLRGLTSAVCGAVAVACLGVTFAPGWVIDFLVR